MIRSLWTAATGMKAQELNLDNISHNLANVNTTAFKRANVEFQDLMYQNMEEAGIPAAAGQRLPVGIQVGLGVKPSAIVKNFKAGSLRQTGNPLDVAIEGDGFFQVMLPDGTIAYTRDGSFKIDADGNLVTADGFYVQPPITIPAEAESISIGFDGTVTVLTNNEPQEIGQITITRFVNPAGLKAIGKNLFLETAASGPALGPFVPGTNGTGSLEQGYLEMSNVNAVEEMVQMIMAQRAYEMNSKVIQAADQMMGTVAALRR